MKTTACSPPPHLCKPSFGYFRSNGLSNSNSLWLHPPTPSWPTLRLCRNTEMRPIHCLPAGSGPPSPPQEDPPHFTGVVSKFRDRVQIFFAVLFWISLFFWACASDGKNSGRPGKGSRSKR